MSTVTISNDPRECLPQEFDDLFREHYPLVYRSAFSVVFNAEDAEDAVQTVFLRILRNGLPAGVKNPKGYLYRAAVNEALKLQGGRATVGLVCIRPGQRVRAGAVIESASRSLRSGRPEMMGKPA